MENAEERSKLPAWLQETQNKSWEPEIIISGLMLTSLFIFPTKLYEFCSMLIQEYGVEYLSAFLILVYLSFVINIFKLFFIVHLTLRLAWTGIVGLSYAFPNGVINERLFKVFSHYEYKKPVELVMQLERLCSIMFAFPVYIGIILVLITFLLFIIVSISTVMGVGILYSIGLFVVLTFSYLIVAFVFKNSGFSKWVATSLSSTISSVYQSNLGKWPVQISAFLFMLFSAPFIKDDINDFEKFYNITGLETKWLSKAEIYYELHQPEKRFARAFVNKATVQNQDFIALNVAYYKADKRVAKKYNQIVGTDNSLGSLNWKQVNDFEDLLKIYLNDSLVHIPSWDYQTLPHTEQKIINTFIDISYLPKGRHTIRIEKLVHADLEPLVSRWRIRKDWAEIPFYKTAH